MSQQGGWKRGDHGANTFVAKLFIVLIGGAFLGAMLGTLLKPKLATFLGFVIVWIALEVWLHWPPDDSGKT